MNINLLRLYPVWGKAFSWITHNSKSLHLFYNNIESSYRLLERCYSIKLTTVISDDNIMILGLASLFRTYNYVENGNNYDNASKGFLEFINQTQLEINSDEVLRIIERSYTEQDFDSTSDLGLIFCDCVFLSKYDEDWISHVFYGYRLEKKMTMKETINEELKLILNPPLSSEWARNEFTKISSSLLVELDMFKKIII